MLSGQITLTLDDTSNNYNHNLIEIYNKTRRVRYKYELRADTILDTAAEKEKANQKECWFFFPREKSLKLCYNTVFTIFSHSKKN